MARSYRINKNDHNLVTLNERTNTSDRQAKRNQKTRQNKIENLEMILEMREAI